MQKLSAFFHLECTNFVVKAIIGILSLSMLRDALQKTLLETEVDILEFDDCHSMVSQALTFFPIGLPPATVKILSRPSIEQRSYQARAYI